MGDLRGLRQDLKARGLRWGVDVKLGEEDAAVNEAEARDDAPGILEGCVRLMGESDAFFGMLFERHGTTIPLAVEPAEVRTAVSYFEAELLEASMTRKPVCIVQSRDIPPSRSLEEFLQLVSRSLGHQIVRIDQDGLLEIFDSFCQLLVRGQAPGSAWLFDTVSLNRVQHSIAREVVDPRLDFLGGLLREDRRGSARNDVIEQALARVDHGVGHDREPLSQLARLTYLWMALREFVRLPSADRFHTHGDQLQRTLSLWNSAAAWYGLHGSHPLGCLAALNDLGYARLQTGRSDMPLGARSSAYYSIGAKLQSRAAARRFFQQSLALSRQQMAAASADRGEMLQMTASAQARLAILGDRWRYFLALNDFRRSLKWREKFGAPQASIGEAMNAYGHALFRLPGQRQTALELASEGSRLLRESEGGMASGFYFRAERKRAEMLGDLGRFDDAIAVADAARTLAKTAQAFDQTKALDELVKQLETRRHA